MPPRLVYTSVTNFLYCGNEYLLLHRNADKTVDANRLNGIGGKLESGEDYLTAAIRETVEETGYVVTPADIRFCGVAKIEGGYQEDWVFCFFKIRVPTKNIPHGNHTKDGELMWLPADQVLNTSHELVDDLRICFPKIVEDHSIFFFHGFVNAQEKIEHYQLNEIPCRQCYNLQL